MTFSMGNGHLIYRKGFFYATVRPTQSCTLYPNYRNDCAASCPIDNSFVDFSCNHELVMKKYVIGYWKQQQPLNVFHFYLFKVINFFCKKAKMLEKFHQWSLRKSYKLKWFQQFNFFFF